MAQKQEIDIGLSIYNKENKDLTYTIIDKKEMNGILHYLIESRAIVVTALLFLDQAISLEPTTAGFSLP